MEDGRPRPSVACGNKKAPAQRRGYVGGYVARAPSPAWRWHDLLPSDGLDHHVFAQLTPVLEYDAARDLGK
jgi:hypothetical protein